MTTHDLKVWPEFFGPLQEGSKLFELRKDDRQFAEGDWLKLREWCPANIMAGTPAGYTGQRCLRQIAYLLRSDDVNTGDDENPYPITEGFVILGLAPPVTVLGCRLQGKRLFVEGVDPKDGEQLTAYLTELHEFVERTKAEVMKAKRNDACKDAGSKA